MAPPYNPSVPGAERQMPEPRASQLSAMVELRVQRQTLVSKTRWRMSDKEDTQHQPLVHTLHTYTTKKKKI